MTISTTCLAFEVTRKRRRGLSVRNTRAPRRSYRPRRQGADRETRAQRSVPVRLRQKLSKNVACAPVASTAASGSIMCAIEVLSGSARLDRRGSALRLPSLPNSIRRSMMAAANTTERQSNMRTITLEEHFAPPGFLDGAGRQLRDNIAKTGPRGAKILEQLVEVGERRIADM